MKRGRPVDCLISIGSNQGQKVAHLRYALAAFDKLPKTKLVRHSSFYDTAPIGPQNQPNYLNAAAWIKTELSPLGLLIELKRLETLCGRKPGRPWGPRPLDCDLLFYGTLRLHARFLEIPHPQALKRKFVLLPLTEIRGAWVPPVHPKRPLREWLRRA